MLFIKEEAITPKSKHKFLETSDETKTELADHAENVKIWKNNPTIMPAFVEVVTSTNHDHDVL